MVTGLENEPTKKEGHHEQQLVVFKVADEEFGVDINEVKEIIRWEEVTRIPNSAPYIKGVINLRGSIIVVNDLAMKLSLPSKTVDDDTRILVVELGENTVGMIVDSATEVLRLSGEYIRDAPSMVANDINNNFIQGVGLLAEKRLLTLLDLTKVLESKDYKEIQQIQKTAQHNIEKIKDIKPEEKPKSKPELKEEKKTEENKPESTPETKPTEEKPAEPEKKEAEKPKTPTGTPPKEETVGSKEEKPAEPVNGPTKDSFKTKDTKKK